MSRITIESLSQSEILSMQRKQAESLPTGRFKAWEDQTEDKAIEDLAQQRQDEQEPETTSEENGSEQADDAGDSNEEGEGGDKEAPAADDQDSEADKDAPTTDDQDSEADKDQSGDTDEDSANDDESAVEDAISDTEPTNESFAEWVTEKTQDSNSAVVRNTGAMIAGLTELGIKYGPVLLTYMYKGVLWSFSRIGTLLYKSSESLESYIEKSKNSLSKLESRLTQVEQAVKTALDDGEPVSTYPYKNKAVIGYLTHSKSEDVVSNVRAFADSLKKTTGSIAQEFEAGIALIDRMAKNNAKPAKEGLSTILSVSPPRQGFSKGTVPGYEADGHVVQYHSELWPGDVCLGFNCPDVKDLDLNEISAAYKKASMYVAAVRSDNTRKSIDSLSLTNLLLFSKSLRILLAACREIDNHHREMKKLTPGIGKAAKRLFFELADEKTKTKMEDTLIEPMFLRSYLATEVFVSGSRASMTHASRVLAAGVKLLEDHAQKLVTQEQ